MADRDAHTAEQAEALANLIDRHKPVTNGAGWPVGCQCLDRVGFPAGRTWADHLALVIEAEHIAGRVMNAKAEQRAEDYARGERTTYRPTDRPGSAADPASPC